MTEHPLCTDPACGACASVRMSATFAGVAPESLLRPLSAGAVSAVTCPQCGHTFEPGVQRVTESAAVEAAKKAPYGDVEYADPGLQPDGKKRYPLDTEDHVRAAWSYINQQKNAAKYSAADLKKVRARIKAAMKKLDISVSENSTTEAVINGKPSWDDLRDLVRRGVQALLVAKMEPGSYAYCYVYIVDISDTDVVWMTQDDDLFMATWSMNADGTVTVGGPVEVVRTYAPISTPDDDPALESTRVALEVDARVLEAKGTDAAGNRIYAVRIIAAGDSKNGRRYPESVLHAAAPLYEGAKAYDHHRTQEEMATGTIQGIVGYYSDVTAASGGIEADLHLLPSATHAAECLDVALQAGGASFVGVSHDVYARFRPIQENGRQLQEATEITSVNSADIVSTPAAGGQAIRAVAGGTPDDPARTVPAGESKETDVAVNAADVLAALSEATPDQLAAVGLAKAGTKTTETRATETDDGAKSTAPAPEKTTETDDLLAKHTFLARRLIADMVTEAELPKEFVKAVADALPEKISESMVEAQIAAQKSALAVAERAGLLAGVGSTVKVTQESLEKKIQALDAFFAKDFINGYRSFKEAFCDITGRRPRAFDEDFNRTILQECYGSGFGSARTRESIDSSTFNLILGDSVTRRMVAEYAQPNLATWRQIVSVVPVNDFRTQRIDRLGGYGTLPAVNQGAPYQSLTSPTNEEATYAITKRGGTEDLTLETIANDDIRIIQRIPTKLGLAAAQTLYRFVWDILPTNAATSFDSTALFHANHNNTDNPAVLSQTTLTAGRVKMLDQSAYGDTKDILSLVPKFIVVPTQLEEIAFQLATSAVAIPSTPAGPSDTPNIHQGITPIRIDYYSDANDWYLVADPNMCPTIEIGFYQGREVPELFTQADNTVGSMFDADKMTWKIRHIYSGTVLDYRGFYRGAN